MPTQTIWLEQKQLELMRMSPDVLRELVLDSAVRASKIRPEHREHYRREYQRDQPGTVRLLARLAPDVSEATARYLAQAQPGMAAHRHVSVGGEDEVLDAARSLFPEIKRRKKRLPKRVGVLEYPAPRAAIATVVAEPLQPLQPSPAAEAPLPATTAVAGLSEQLFPEVRERRAQQGNRVTWADR